MCSFYAFVVNILYILYLEKEVKKNFVFSHQSICQSWHVLSSDTDIADKTVEHSIDLYETPFKQQPRRIPPSMYQEVRNPLQELLDADIIRKPKSPFSSNVVLLKKEKMTNLWCVLIVDSIATEQKGMLTLYISFRKSLRIWVAMRILQHWMPSLDIIKWTHGIYCRKLGILRV
jgi:hypothetical protein